MAPLGDWRRARFWLADYWRRCVGVTFVVLLVSQAVFLTWSDVDVAARPASVASVAGPNQGDRRLAMVVVAATPTSSGPAAAASAAPAAPSDADAENVDPFGRGPASDSNGEWMRRQKRRFDERNRRIADVCQRRGVRTATPAVIRNFNESTVVATPGRSQDPPMEQANLEHFTLARSFRTMGCFVNKVASSSLVSAFLLTSGYNASFSSPHSYAPRLRPRTLTEFELLNATYFKFMFVRHPMERLLSCYLDKMVESTHWSLPPYRRYVHETARNLLKKRQLQQQQQRQLAAAGAVTRIGRVLHAAAETPPPPPSSSLSSSSGAAEEARKKLLAQFMDGIDMDGNGTGPKQPPSAAAAAYSKLPPVTPTFEEFLEFILATDLMGKGYDSHWVPYWRYCSPCSVDYHVVGKLETAADDFRYIWNGTGLEAQVPIPWVNKKKSKQSDKSKKLDLERKYYSSVSRQLILRVYERFRLDFEMFDYSINEILARAGYEPIDELTWSP